MTALPVERHLRDATPSELYLSLETIEFRRVLENDLASHIIRNSDKVSFDHLARVGPSRIRMWEIRRPHVIVRPEELIRSRTNRIILERRPELSPHIIAGLKR